MKHQFDQTSLVEALLGSISMRQAALTWLYEQSGWRSWVLLHVRSNGSDEVQGEDVFQESVILFDRNIREGRFRGESNPQTYFFGIAKQVSFNKNRSKQRTIEFSAEMAGPTTDTPEKNLLENEQKSAIETITAALGEHCRRVLSLYKLSLSNEEIAQELGLSSPELAKKYCYRCREKFKAFVLSRPELMELLNIKIKNGQEGDVL